jgi:ankyrin repeat protein
MLSRCFAASLRMVAQNLRVAVAEGHKDIVSLLLDSGADINLKDEVCPAVGVACLATEMTDQCSCRFQNHWTALHHAASRGHKDIVFLLLEKGAHINAKDNEVCFIMRITCV